MAGVMVANDQPYPASAAAQLERHADVRPILEAKVIGLEDEPERNRKERHAREGDRGIVQARAVGEREDGARRRSGCRRSRRWA